jgi:hypothetical protein
VSKKPRLFSVDVETAAQRIERAIDRRAAHAAFPWHVVLAIRFGQLLPAALCDALLAGRGRKPKLARRT